jgi:hypothetical protein
MKRRLRFRREPVAVAAALLLPIPLLVACALLLPLPTGVERGIVSLLPGAGDGATEIGSAMRVTTPGARPGSPGDGLENHTRPRPAAGVLESGSATAPAAGNEAIGGVDDSTDRTLPGDERPSPGSGEDTDPPIAPQAPGGDASAPPRAPGGSTGTDKPAPVVNERVSAGVVASNQGLEVDVTGGGASAGLDADLDDAGIAVTVGASAANTSSEATVTVPVPPIPRLP